MSTSWGKRQLLREKMRKALHHAHEIGELTSDEVLMIIGIFDFANNIVNDVESRLNREWMPQ